MSLVSQLDGGFHVQYFAYEWTIVQAITWPYQTFWSIFWVFFTSELSSVSGNLNLNPKCLLNCFFPGRRTCPAGSCPPSGSPCAPPAPPEGRFTNDVGSFFGIIDPPCRYQIQTTPSQLTSFEHGPLKLLVMVASLVWSVKTTEEVCDCWWRPCRPPLRCAFAI